MMNPPYSALGMLNICTPMLSTDTAAIVAALTPRTFFSSLRLNTLTITISARAMNASSPSDTP